MKIRNIWQLVIVLAVLLSGSWASAVEYTYDSLNRLTQVAYVSGARIDYTYDPAGNLTNMIHTVGGISTAPGAPSIDSIVAGIDSAMIYFSAPASNGGSAITSYSATCTATGQTTRTATGTGSPLTVSNLVTGVNYDCTVAATNSDGLTSSASASLSVTPLTSVLVPVPVPVPVPVSIPGTPIINSIVYGINSATIYFSSPVSNSSTAVSSHIFTPISKSSSTDTSYTATCIATGQTTRIATGAGSPLTVFDLVTGVNYDCTVAATNSAGTSADSPPITVTPPPVSGKFPWTMFLPAITRGVK